jgi:hypothetical protein
VQSERFHISLRDALSTVQGGTATYMAGWGADPATAESPVIQISPHSRPGFLPFPNEQPNNYLVMYLADRRTAGFLEQVNASISRTPGGNLSNVYAKIDARVSSDQLRPAFQRACEHVLNLTLSTWQSGQGKAAGIEVDALSHQYIPLDKMGAGVANCVGLIVELLVSKGKLFLIEEPETELHPQALRGLLDLIADSARDQNNQFVISTHSNVVVRHLGSLADTVIHHIERLSPIHSNAHIVSNDPASRLELLRSLGYELSDFELYSAWLILEESSAEAIIRMFMLKWFAPKLVGRLQTIASHGTGDVEPRFADFARVFTFLHREPAFREMAWVICDGDQSGREIVEKLRSGFKDWPPEAFSYFDAVCFEHYYPAYFKAEVDRVLAIANRQQKRTAKRELVESVKKWLDANEDEGRKQLGISAAPVIARLKAIEDKIAPSAAV